MLLLLPELMHKYIVMLPEHRIIILCGTHSQMLPSGKQIFFQLLGLICGCTVTRVGEALNIDYVRVTPNTLIIAANHIYRILLKAVNSVAASKKRQVTVRRLKDFTRGKPWGRQVNKWTGRLWWRWVNMWPTGSEESNGLLWIPCKEISSLTFIHLKEGRHQSVLVVNSKTPSSRKTIIENA